MFSIGVILAGIVMVASFVGMLFCAKLQRSQPNAKFLAIGLLFVVLICGGYILSTTMGDGDVEEIMDREKQYAKAAAIEMGAFLAKKYPGSIPAIIASPNYQKNPRELAIIDGLKQSLKTAIVAPLQYPKRPKGAPGGPEAMPMMDDMMNAKQFNQLFKKYDKNTLFITIRGLPMDVHNMSIWKDDKKKMAILLNGDVYNLKKAIELGKICGLVTYKPGVKFEDKPCPRDPKEAFNERYILITPENIKKVATEYKDLFPGK